MQKSVGHVLLVAGALSLAGCSSIFGGKQAAMHETGDLDIEEIYHAYAVEQLDLGRSMIRNGAFAAAIEPLRRASRDPHTAPASYNALGVAYVKLGRANVASRFFNLAVLLEPDNPTFAGNFSRMKAELLARSGNASETLAMADNTSAVEPDEASDVQDRPAVAVAVENAGSRVVAAAFGNSVHVGDGNGRIERVSSHEVRIGGPRHSPRGMRRDIARTSYPLRVKFGKDGETGSREEASGAGYPLRVQF